MEFCQIVSILFLTVFTDISTTQGCGKYCICSLERTDCYFSFDNDGNCLGKVPQLETYVLNIHGPVCDNVRKLLRQNTFSNTIKVFHNDVCDGVANCR